MVLGSFVANGELSFGFNMGFERFVGIVRDIFFFCFFFFLSFSSGFGIVMRSREEGEDLEGRVWRAGF